MTEMKALGICDMEDSDDANKQLTITLKEEFRWFLTEAFGSLTWWANPPHGNSPRANTRGGAALVRHWGTVGTEKPAQRS